MSFLPRSFVLVITVLLCAGVHAQNGVRFLLYDYEPLVKNGGDWQNVGIGFDHDLTDELSCGVDMRFGLVVQSWAVQYRSAFHFSDNESGSFYMGPTIGVRDLGDDAGTKVVPLGMRIGVRGGLENFYADIYAGVNTYLGGGGIAAYTAEGDVVKLRTASFNVGLSLGYGWAGGNKR